MQHLETPGAIAKYQGSFTPIRPAITKLNIIGFDSEDDTKGNPISFAFHDGKKSFYTTSADKAISYVYNCPKTTCFVAHNLEYDIGNLFKACDFKYIEEMVYASKLLKATLFGTKNFFINSQSFFAGSLASLGQIVGVEKLEGDPLNPAYNIRDALIPQVFMSNMQDRLNALGVNLGLSIGQIAMAVYRRNFMPGPQVTFNHPEVLKAYYGGRVEVFFKGVTPPGEKLYITDIKSSYPDVMRNKRYPDTSRMERSTLDTHEFGIGRFHVHVPADTFIPPLPYRSPSGRLFFPTGNLIPKSNEDCYWTYAEIRHAVSVGCTVLHEEPGFGTNHFVNPYVDFVDHFWEERVAAEKLRNLSKNTSTPNYAAEFDYLLFKLILNNRYGKDAQHKAGVKMTRVRLSPSKLAKMSGATENRIGPFYGYNVPRVTAPKTANYLWGVYTTAYARLSLLEKMEAVHKTGATLLYCDTDSVMFTGKQGLSALDIGDDLGQMSLETFDLGVFRQAKGYLLCNRQVTRYHVSKGKVFHNGKPTSATLLDTRLVLPEVSLGDFMVEKVACKGVPTAYALDFIKTGMVSFRKPMRLKEAVIRTYAKANEGKDEEFFANVGVNVWREVEKTMKGIYAKRSGKNGVTLPVNVDDIPAILDASWGPPTEMDEMKSLPVRQKTRKKDVFTGVALPKNWFKRGQRLEAAAEFFESQRIHFLKFEELAEVPPGGAWFKGVCETTSASKYGPYYVIRLSEFLGQPLGRKVFRAAFPFSYAEKLSKTPLTGKTITVFQTAEARGLRLQIAA